MLKALIFRFIMHFFRALCLNRVGQKLGSGVCKTTRDQFERRALLSNKLSRKERGIFGRSANLGKFYSHKFCVYFFHSKILILEAQSGNFRVNASRTINTLSLSKMSQSRGPKTGFWPERVEKTRRGIFGRSANFGKFYSHEVCAYFFPYKILIF